MKEWQLLAKSQIVALLAVAVDWLSVFGLYCCKLHYLGCITIGMLNGALFEFIIKRYWVFAQPTSKLSQQAITYTAVSLGAWLINSGLSFMVIDKLHYPVLPWVYLTSCFSGLVWTYPLHRYWVFNS